MLRRHKQWKWIVRQTNSHEMECGQKQIKGEKRWTIAMPAKFFVAFFIRVRFKYFLLCFGFCKKFENMWSHFIALFFCVQNASKQKEMNLERDRHCAAETCVYWLIRVWEAVSSISVRFFFLFSSFLLATLHNDMKPLQIPLLQNKKPWSIARCLLFSLVTNMPAHSLSFAAWRAEATWIFHWLIMCDMAQKKKRSNRFIFYELSMVFVWKWKWGQGEGRIF